MAIPKSEQRARNLEAQKRCRARKAEKKRKRNAASRDCNARIKLAKLLKRAEKFAAAAVAKDAEASGASGAQIPECPICLEELDDASPSLACNHRFHAACLQELAATAWAEGAARTRARGTAVLCPCCRGQSYVK